MDNLWIKTILLSTVKGICTSLASNATKHVYNFLSILDRNDCRTRVVCAAFLSIQDERQRYALIKNIHRNFYSPIGGCYKFTKGHIGNIAEKFGFESDKTITGDESSLDIRGTISSRKKKAFLAWYNSCEHRETHIQCLHREAIEELVGESNLTISENLIHSLSFTKIRSYTEKSHVQGTQIKQVRIFEVFALDPFNPSTHQFIERIQNSFTKNIVWASKDEILRGRHKKTQNTIGHASELLFRGTITGHDSPLLHD